MPVHGEWRHLRANAELGALTGVPADRIVIAEDGVVVDLVKGKAKIVGKVQAGYVYVDGLSVGGVTEASLKDRRILGDEGFISVFVVVDSSTGKIVSGPSIHSRAPASTTRPSPRSSRRSTRPWPSPPRTGSSRPTSCSSWCAVRSASGCRTSTAGVR